MLCQFVLLEITYPPWHLSEMFAICWNPIKTQERSHLNSPIPSKQCSYKPYLFLPRHDFLDGLSKQSTIDAWYLWWTHGKSSYIRRKTIVTRERNYAQGPIAQIRRALWASANRWGRKDRNSSKVFYPGRCYKLRQKKPADLTRIVKKMSVSQNMN